MKKNLKLFLCGIDYQHELGECEVKVFESVDRLKLHNKCWEQCGIIEIDISINKTKWIVPQNIFGDKS